MKKAISDIRSGFATTQNPWRPLKSSIFTGDISWLSRTNLYWFMAMGYFLYKTMNNQVVSDGLERHDFSSLPMIFVAFWLLYEAQKQVGGLFLNDGVSTEKQWRKWNSRYADQVRQITLAGGGRIR